MTTHTLSPEAVAARKPSGQFGKLVPRRHDDRVADNLRPATAADVVIFMHPWASDDMAARIIAGTPETVYAEHVDGYEFDDEEDGPFCKNCGEELVTNLDGQRGLLGHGATSDATCMTAERAAAIGYALRVSARGYDTTNEVEAERLRERAQFYAGEAERLILL